MRTTFAALTALVATAALADQATLYERHEFRGRSVTLQREAPDLRRAGMDDRASSLRVSSGTWEACTEPGFRGDCRLYREGDYPRLGRQSDRISSIRPVRDRPGPGPGPGAGGDGAEVELFDRQDFSGPLRRLTGPTPNFEPLGINDAAASIIVHRGTWEFCTDANYRGDCTTYRPGRYAVLPGKDDRYSSARPVAGGGGGSGVGGGHRVRLRLFEHANFAGRSISLDGDAPNFERLGFNDRAESAIVEGGDWRLCSDARGGGECRLLRPGRYPSLPHELRNRVSSAFLR